MNNGILSPARARNVSFRNGILNGDQSVTWPMARVPAENPVNGVVPEYRMPNADPWIPNDYALNYSQNRPLPLQDVIQFLLKKKDKGFQVYGSGIPYSDEDKVFNSLDQAKTYQGYINRKYSV